MTIYFERAGFKVIDFRNPNFAKYAVTNTSRAFDDLDEAILFCIGKSYSKCNNSQLDAYVNTFLTMIKK